MKIDPEHFWQQPEKWPLNISGYVFLGRAVLQVAGAQLEPPEAFSHPLSARMKKSYNLAAERISSEAASGNLKTAALTGERFDPMAPMEWATIDRQAVFRCFFRFPGKVYRPGIFAESKQPIYVEAVSLSNFVDWTRLQAKAAEASAAFARVQTDRYSFANRPNMLPPRGFMSIDDALKGRAPDEDPARVDDIRRLLHMGVMEAILQFWESGELASMPADFWGHAEALSAFSDNGAVTVPDEIGRDGAYSKWAYVRLRLKPISSQGEPTTQERSSADQSGPRQVVSKRGAPNLAAKDRPFIEMMRALVEGEMYSPNKASGIIVAENRAELAGTGSDESKARRLREGYKTDRRQRGLGEIGD